MTSKAYNATHHIWLVWFHGEDAIHDLALFNGEVMFTQVKDGLFPVSVGGFWGCQRTTQTGGDQEHSSSTKTWTLHQLKEQNTPQSWICCQRTTQTGGDKEHSSSMKTWTVQQHKEQNTSQSCIYTAKLAMNDEPSVRAHSRVLRLMTMMVMMHRLGMSLQPCLLFTL